MSSNKYDQTTIQYKNLDLSSQKNRADNNITTTKLTELEIEWRESKLSKRWKDWNRMYNLGQNILDKFMKLTKTALF